MLRLRLSAYLLPIAFYALSALVSGYFLWHATNGQRGLKMRDEYSQRVAELQETLDRLHAERARWAQKIALVKGETIDRDVLDEQARIELGRIHKNEVVILISDATAKSR